MEALSKAPGAETAVGEGDKRRAELGAGSCYGRAPPLPSIPFLFKGGFKGRRRGGGREWAEHWMRCLSDPLCLCPPLLAWDVFIPAVERGPSHYLMKTMVISLPTWWRWPGGGESRGHLLQTRWRRVVTTGNYFCSVQERLIKHDPEIPKYEESS